jgi:hypothetical protein
MNDSQYHQLSTGGGAKPRKRTPQQKEATRRKARREANTTIVQLSDYLARPLDPNWKDARADRQYWLGNFYRHLDELADSETPPPLFKALEIPAQIASVIIQIYRDRGLPIDLPDPPTPVAAAIGIKRAA